MAERRGRRLQPALLLAGVRGAPGAPGLVLLPGARARGDGRREPAVQVEVAEVKVEVPQRAGLREAAAYAPAGVPDSSRNATFAAVEMSLLQLAVDQTRCPFCSR